MSKACIPRGLLPELLRPALHQMPRVREPELQRDHPVPEQVLRTGLQAPAREWIQTTHWMPERELRKDCLQPEPEPLLQRDHPRPEREHWIQTIHQVLALE